jgi:hypothetical protein
MKDTKSHLTRSGVAGPPREIAVAIVAMATIIGAQSAANANAYPLAIGDFTGDGKTDVTVWRPSSGYWFSIDSGNGWGISTQWGGPGDVPVSGDFSFGAADGKADNIVFRPSEGNWYWIDSVTGSGWWQNWGGQGDIPAVGDFDGDGLSDITVWRHFPNGGYPGGTWWVINSHDWSVSAVQWGQEGDIPVPCDYDGDGISDLAVFRPSAGTFYVSRSLGGTMTQALGTQGDIPLPGDYDGDGQCDVAVWHPYNGSWTYKSSYTGNFSSTNEGLNGDVPVPGDYDGDGRIDKVLWRPSNATFSGYLTGGGQVNVSWGSGGPNNGGIGSDVPVPNYPGASNLLADVLMPQEQSNWCWAATAQMTAGYSLVSMPQCEQANVATSRSDCCTDPAAASDTGRCNVPGWWSQLPNFGFTYTDSTWGSAISFAQLQIETNASRPVPYAWGWTGGGGHAMVVVKTFVPTLSAPWVSINNPWPPNTGDQADMSYYTWVSDVDHVHWQDSYNVILH